MKIIKPFANESDSIGIDELTIENRFDRVSLYGSIDLTRDKAGLDHARTLRALLDRVIKTLEAEKSLPDKLPPPEKKEEVKNPFK
jgi:hypothetical protein